MRGTTNLLHLPDLLLDSVDSGIDLRGLVLSLAMVFVEGDDFVDNLYTRKALPLRFFYGRRIASPLKDEVIDI